MAFSEFEPSPPHLTYLVLTSFLILYALFSLLIRNRLHLSEPPLATAFGIAVGPRGLNLLTPHAWGFTDAVVQETTRVIVGIQCFAVGLELPDGYIKHQWKGLVVLLGPVMTFGWLVCAVFIMTIFNTDFPTALTISACLTPTDPILAASILSNSQFSTRVPKRIRNLLSAESGTNDGVSFPFLFMGINFLIKHTTSGALKKWFLITVLYQCVLGVVIGTALGYAVNWLYNFSHKRQMMGTASYLAFYLLLAIFSIGLASTLGVDDFLVAFCAGRGFSHGGNSPTAQTRLPVIIDLMLNSALFVFFGAIIPWSSFDNIDTITPLRLVAVLALILFLRRIPIVFTLYKLTLIPLVRSTTEALFVGHFGPMGAGALFLAYKARDQLQTDEPLLFPKRARAAALICPIVCFIVLGSTLVHGLSTLAISVGGHFTRHEGERAPLIGAERDGLYGMLHDDGEVEGEGEGEE